MKKVRSAVAYPLLSAILACSQAPDSPVGIIDQSVSLNVISGANQAAIEYTQLPAPIVVQILNAKGKPVGGQIVNFRVVQGGGSVYAGAAVTDNQGIARDWWTVGSANTRNLLEARAVDPSSGAQLVLGTVLAFPTPLIDPRVQFKCGNQADWEPPQSGPGPGECYGGGGEFVPSYPNGAVVHVQVRVTHNNGVPVPNMWLDFYASHNAPPAGAPSVTPVYGVTDALGITSLDFTIGSVAVANDLLVVGPAGIVRVQTFKAGF